MIGFVEGRSRPSVHEMTVVGSGRAPNLTHMRRGSTDSLAPLERGAGHGGGTSSPETNSAASSPVGGSAALRMPIPAVPVMSFPAFSSALSTGSGGGPAPSPPATGVTPVLLSTHSSGGSGGSGGSGSGLVVVDGD